MKKVIIHIVTLLVTFSVVTMNSAIVCAADDSITTVQVSAENEAPSEESIVDGGGSTPLTVHQAAMLAVKAGIVWQDEEGFFHLVIEPSIGEPPIEEEEPTAPTEAPTEVVSIVDEAKTVAAIDDDAPIEENISNNDVTVENIPAEELTNEEHPEIGSAIWRDASGWFHTSDGYNWWEPLYPEAEDGVLLDVADPIPPVVDPDKVCDCCEGVDLAQLPYMGWMDNDGVWHLREIGVYPFVATEQQ